MLQLRLEELFTPPLLKAFRERWGISPADADLLALRTVGMFELQDKETDKSASRRRKDSWLKLMINALIGPEPDFLAWIEALTIGNYDIREGNFYSRASGKGQPAAFLQRQRKHIDSLVAKEKLNPAEREERRIAYLDALRQVLVAVLLRELKAACTGKAAVGPAWPLVKATDRLKVEERGLLRYYGGEDGFDQHLAAALTESLIVWTDQRHDGSAPNLTKNYYEKGLPPDVNKPDALKHLDRDNVAIERYRAKLSQALELDPALPVRATTGANPEEIVKGDAAIIRAALTVQEAGPYRFFTEANGADERFEYDDEQREDLIANLPVLTSSASYDQRKAAAGRARRRSQLRQSRPGRMLDHDLQEEIANYVAQELLPPRALTPEHAIYFEEEVCLHYELAFCWHDRWEQIGLAYPSKAPF